MVKRIDLTGNRYGRLTVIGREGSYTHKGGSKSATWKCLCDCGNEVIVPTCRLKSGNTKSCGCFHKEKLADRNKTSAIHGGKSGGKPERLYRIWSGIRRRCYEETLDAYKYYGSRGITVCDDWKNDYSKFREWSLNNGYKDNLSIDRIDVNGNYSPENCRWIDAKTQANNRRNNVCITYHGKTQTVAQWAEETGMPYRRIEYRLKAGWEVQKIFDYKNERRNTGGVST